MYKLHLIPLEERIVLDAAAGAVIFVDTNAPVAGLNDGSSWVNAYKNLQAALTQAAGTVGVAEQIWVADGVYNPSVVPVGLPLNFTNRPTFVVPNLTSIYGGFEGSINGVGGETSIDQRVFTAIGSNNMTILDGDLDPLNPDNIPGTTLNRFDPLYLATKTDNAQHVLTIVQSAVTLDGLTIMNGFASSSVGGAAVVRHQAGGGIILSGGSLTMSHVSLINNDARAFGTTGQIVPMGEGGGLYAEPFNRLGTNPAPAISLDHVIVANNFAERFGGGMNMRGGSATNIVSLDISHSIIRDNAAIRDDGISNGTGGGLELIGVAGQISDTTFDNNVASNIGGASTSGGGGALFLNNTGTNLTILRSIFENNKSILTAGAIFQMGNTTDLNIRDSIFRNNSTASPTGLTTFGAAAELRGRATIENTLFENNQAVFGSGAALNVQSTGVVNLINDVFRGNSSFGNGPNAVNMSGGSIFNLGVLTIEGSLIENNTVAGSNLGVSLGRGGAIITSSLTGLGAPVNKLTISNSTIRNNFAGLHGGGIYSGIASTLEITNSQIHGNSALQDGGGLYILGGSHIVGATTIVRTTTVTLTNVHFNQNEAGRHGGSLAAVGRIAPALGIISLTVFDSHFLNGNSVLDGGSVYLDNLDQVGSLAEFQNNHFNHNEALNNGGAIASYNSNLLLLKNKFANNDAEFLGRDVYISIGSSEVNDETVADIIQEVLAEENHYGDLSLDDDITIAA